MKNKLDIGQIKVVKFSHKVKTIFYKAGDKMNKVATKFPRQANLAGALRKYDVTYEEAAKAVGFKGAGAIEAIINGRVDFKMSVARKLRNFLSKKGKLDLNLSEIID